MKNGCLMAIFAAVLLLSGGALAEVFDFDSSPMQVFGRISADSSAIYESPGGVEIAPLEQGDRLAAAFWGGDWEWMIVRRGETEGYVRVADVALEGLEESFLNRDVYLFEQRPELNASDASVRSETAQKGSMVFAFEYESAGNPEYIVLNSEKTRIYLLPGRSWLGEIPEGWGGDKNMSGWVRMDTPVYDESGAEIGELHLGDAVTDIVFLEDMCRVSNGNRSEHCMLPRDCVSLWPTAKQGFHDMLFRDWSLDN